jgi:hypothetical protein
MPRRERHFACGTASRQEEIDRECRPAAHAARDVTASAI